MTYSSACANLVKQFEGLRLTAYLCPAGIWTIGWGHTAGVHQGDQINTARAESFLAADLGATAAALNSILPSSLAISQGQFDALTSLGFNMAGGPSAIPHKAPKLWANLLAGNFAVAAQQFLDIDHAFVAGQLVELPGLKARRQAEAAMFVAG